ncbi:MAG: TIGR00730 family Rossman fold protein [Hyphomicrobiaceae bacterium]|nr:TIGR00730 family Rossman fold protein [Hyphomicrobiaceae bacterium]
MPKQTPSRQPAKKPAPKKAARKTASGKTAGATSGTAGKAAARRAPGAGGPAKGSSKPGAVRNVCVYCGSGHGLNPSYTQAAQALGQSFAEAGVGLVYGGGGLGLMGEVARATLAAGGHVTGIIPDFLTQKEHMLIDVQKLIVTKDMHERKRLMFEYSDAFVALPGGVGTLEELVEQLTWSQLGRHAKPIVVANIAGFWDPFLNLLAHMRDDQFIRNGINVRFIVVDKAEAILPAILSAAKASGETVPDAVVTAKF